jgi:hypothetical protein
MCRHDLPDSLDATALVPLVLQSELLRLDLFALIAKAVDNDIRILISHSGDSSYVDQIFKPLPSLSSYAILICVP